MPTQRPFLSNCLAAFRNHTPPISKVTPAITSSAATTSTSAATLWTAAAATTSQKAQQTQSENTPTSPRPIKPKVQPYASTTQHQQTLQHTVSPSTHLPRSSSSPGPPVYGPPNKPSPSYPTCQESRRARRGSDSSSEGFRDVRAGGTGGEKWFIGGRTATGEEKYYKLAMVRRDRSADRISADQLSL